MAITDCPPNDEHGTSADARLNADYDDVRPSSTAACAWLCVQAKAAQQGRCLQKLLGSLGSPNDLDQDVSIFGATAVGFDTLYQRQTRFGAQIYFLEVLGQLQSSKHGGLHLRRDTVNGFRFRRLI